MFEKVDQVGIAGIGRQPLRTQERTDRGAGLAAKQAVHAAGEDPGILKQALHTGRLGLVETVLVGLCEGGLPAIAALDQHGAEIAPVQAEPGAVRRAFDREGAGGIHAQLAVTAPVAPAATMGVGRFAIDEVHTWAQRRGQRQLTRAGP